MTFRLNLTKQVGPVANSANLRIDQEQSSPAPAPIRRFATFATPALSDEAEHEAKVEHSARLWVEGMSRHDADAAAGLAPWSESEIERFVRVQARVAGLGWPKQAEHVAELAVQLARQETDLRLCIDCAHAGRGWRCGVGEAFFLDVGQRCPKFEEGDIHG